MIMAISNSPFYNLSPQLPPWMLLVVDREFERDVVRVRLAVSCHDGAATVFDATVATYAASRLSIPLTKREVLESMHKQVVVELSKLEMES